MQPLDFKTLKERYGAEIKALAAKHKLENVRVFGSVVRGDAGPNSDIDLLVHPGLHCSLFELMDFEDDLAVLFEGHDIDVVSDRALSGLIAPIIISEAKPL